MLPFDDDSQFMFLVRVDFSDDDAWAQVVDTVDADGFSSGAVIVDDEANRGQTPVGLVGEVGEGSFGVVVADRESMTSADHLLLVVPSRDAGDPFRVPAKDLGFVISPLVVGTGDWESIFTLVDADRVFRMPGH